MIKGFEETYVRWKVYGAFFFPDIVGQNYLFLRSMILNKGEEATTNISKISAKLSYIINSLEIFSLSCVFNTIIFTFLHPPPFNKYILSSLFQDQTMINHLLIYSIYVFLVVLLTFLAAPWFPKSFWMIFDIHLVVQSKN